MNRRTFLKSLVVLPVAAPMFAPNLLLASKVGRKRFAITMDDPNVKASPLLTATERNAKILETLDSAKIKATLFVCGKRVDNPEGKILLDTWNAAGHSIANHTYSHINYNDPATTYEIFTADVLKGEAIIAEYEFARFLRFPYLKEGDTAVKRDHMREFLKNRSYRNGSVSLDGSDWYIDARLQAKLKVDPKADLKPYLDFYLWHMLARATFYDDLGVKLTGRPIKHTMLVHHTLTNALFLGDIINGFKDHGWKLIDSTEAFADPIFDEMPNAVPAGESLIWEMAKATGKYNSILRYPGEDDSYEKPEMDRLGL